jgi:hypothetical protein
VGQVDELRLLQDGEGLLEAARRRCGLGDLKVGGTYQESK